MDVEDDGVSRAELTHRDDFGYRGPHCRGYERECDAEYNHNQNCKPPDVEQGQCKQNVYQCEHCRADNHQGCTLAQTVVERAEYGSQQNGAEGQHRGDKTCQLGLNAILVNHQLGGELQEGEYTRVEEHAQNCNQPETFVAENELQVAEMEALLLFDCALVGRGRSVELAVHHAIYQVGEETNAQQRSTQQHGSSHRVHTFGQGEAASQCRSGTNTRHSHLQAHSQSQLVTSKPFCNNFGYGDAGNLGTHTEHCEAQRCEQHLCGHTEELCIGCEVAFQCIPFDDGTQQHQSAAGNACEANTALVENDTAEEKHQQEYVDVTVGTREEAVVIACPAQTTLRGEFCEQVLERSHHVGDEVTAHHRKRYDNQGAPACCRRVIESFL